jgi:hypothetical protein
MQSYKEYCAKYLYSAGIQFFSSVIEDVIDTIIFDKSLLSSVGWKL